MLKLASVGTIALCLIASPTAYAQTPPAGAQTAPAGATDASDLAALADARILIVKSALQLTPDQEKYWPAVEKALRERAKGRQARIERLAARMEQMSQQSRVEILRERNPVDFLHRRSEALAQRANELKMLADAWQPLYQTLSPEQKKRMALITMVAVRGMRNALDERRAQIEEEEEDED